MTKRERQAREYAAERIETDFWRLMRFSLERRLTYATLVCSGAKPADAAMLAAASAARAYRASLDEIDREWLRITTPKGIA